MTATVAPINDDIYYDSDDARPRNSPLMKPINPKISPSPSPPPPFTITKVSPAPSPDRKRSNRPKVRASQGDAVLVSFLGGGRHPGVAFEAAANPLPSISDPPSDEESNMPQSPEPPGFRGGVEPPQPGEEGGMLRIWAAGALAQFTAISQPESSSPGKQVPAPDDRARPAVLAHRGGQPLTSSSRDIPIRDTQPILAAPPISYPSRDPYSPHQNGPLVAKTPTAAAHRELPPLQNLDSPKSDVNGRGPLPSIRSQLGDFKSLGPEKDIAVRRGPNFSRSPPAGLPRLSSIPNHPTSPPISPNDPYRRELPSPAHSLSAVSPFYFPTNGAHGRHGTEYSSSATETPSTDQSASTPATSITDRMSIDGITHPQVGYMCNVPGCQAPPFQTQYLLNSHANVHSSARPHYCSVVGCPRSEGGKGFKRKNEMIRHGLVHDSPGYVCPFCPDREHKYPRPDNLQR